MRPRDVAFTGKQASRSPIVPHLRDTARGTHGSQPKAIRSGIRGAKALVFLYFKNNSPATRMWCSPFLLAACLLFCPPPGFFSPLVSPPTVHPDTEPRVCATASIKLHNPLCLSGLLIHVYDYRSIHVFGLFMRTKLNAN